MTPQEIYQQDRQQAYNRHDEIRRANGPDKLANMPLVQVQEYYNELYSLRDWLHGAAWALSACNERLDLLRREIELKTISERSDRQHKQVICVSGWTLFWAIVGALGTIGLLLLEMPVSKLLHAISSRTLRTKQPIEIADFCDSDVITTTATNTIIVMNSFGSGVIRVISGDDVMVPCRC